MAAWWDADWLVVDTETTGIDTDTAQVVELGFVPFSNGAPQARYGRLLNPGCPIPEEAASVHGIHDADVADCPTLDEVAERFLDHVRGATVLVGYNLLGYDAPLLEARLGDAWRAAIENVALIDPLIMVRMGEVGRYWSGRGRHQLTNVAQRLGISPMGPTHRATTDCIMAGEVLWSLRTHPAVTALGDEPHTVAARLLELKDAQDADFQAWKAKQAAAIVD